MDKNKKLSFQKEMEREAKKIEEELKAHPELNDLTVSDELDAALREQIQAYEKEQKKDTMETEKKIVKFPRKKKLIFTLVAMLVLVCAMGVTSIGSKSYLKKVEDGIYGTQKVQNVDVDDMEKQESSDEGEVFAFKEVKRMLGMTPVMFNYKPSKMEFLRCQIDKEEQRAKLFYTCEDDMIRYDIYKNESDSSLGQNQEDKLIDEFELNIADQLINVKRYEIEDVQEEYCLMSFKYKEVNYQLKGKIEEEELKKIAENLKFL